MYLKLNDELQPALILTQDYFKKIIKYRNQKVKPTKEDYIFISGDYYSIVPNPNTICYLYNSVRLFYKKYALDSTMTAEDINTDF